MFMIMDKIKLVLFATLCLFNKCFAQVGISSGQYVAYYNYTVVGVNTQTGQFSPTLDYCFALANALESSNGAMYNDASKSCVVLTSYNNEILLKLTMTVGWTTYVKDISNKQKLVFKMENGWDTDWTLEYPYWLWLSNEIPMQNNYSAGVESLKLSTGCKCRYRNDYLPYLTTNSAKRVYIRSYSQGSMVAQIVFDGSATQYMSPFPLGSSVIGATPFNHQMVRLKSSLGYTPSLFYWSPWQATAIEPTRCGRFFSWYEVGTTQSDCYNFKFYMFASSENGSPCPCTFPGSNFPRLFYSATSDTASLSSYGLLSADIISVYIEVVSRVYYA